MNIRIGNSIKITILAFIAGMVLMNVGISTASGETENPKSDLPPAKELSSAWKKREAKAYRQFDGCHRYVSAYRLLMKIRKPALNGPNYGYGGDKGGKDVVRRGYSFMANLSRAANGAYHYGWPNKPKSQRQKLRRKMRQNALYWAKRGLAIYNEASQTNFAYLPYDDAAQLQLVYARAGTRDY